MPTLFVKKILIIVIAFAVLGIGAFVVISRNTPVEIVVEPILEILPPVQQVMGMSIEGRDILSYTYGSGETHLVFVGGMHGGYEWNSVVLAYSFIDYLEENLKLIPKNISVTVIPSINPDGVYKIIGKEGRFTTSDVPKNKPTEPGRFNANNVDLNRNFDCKWKRESMWKGNKVSAGNAPFSEPETKAFRNFVLKNKSDGVVFWHSQSNAVYASECEKGILPRTLDIMNVYAKAAGYPAVESFDAYEITGDAEGWLAKNNIPAITVELKTHETIEWEKNLLGIKALFEYYKK